MNARTSIMSYRFFFSFLNALLCYVRSTNCVTAVQFTINITECFRIFFLPIFLQEFSSKQKSTIPPEDMESIVTEVIEKETKAFENIGLQSRSKTE